MTFSSAKKLFLHALHAVPVAMAFVPMFFHAPSAEAAKLTFRMEQYGVVPGADSLSVRIDRAMRDIQAMLKKGDTAVLKFKRGTYCFRPEESVMHDFYISNHDQVVHHPTALCIAEWEGITIDGSGSRFLCTGRMLPVAITESRNVALRNLSIDFDTPHISQVEVTANDASGIRFRPLEGVNWRINDDRRFEAYGQGWSSTYSTGIAFDGTQRYIVPQTSDLWIDMASCSDAGNGEVLAPNWKDGRLKPGTRVALRSYHRPAPAVVVNESEGVDFSKVTVYYAEGMGIVAQRSADIHLNAFNVVPDREKGRYFSTQADATHFVQCRGEILVENSIYDGMMDDAINVHGVYLRVRERKDDHTLLLRFEHSQAYGYNWGNAGDTVAFVRSATMDELPQRNVIYSIRRCSPTDFEVQFQEALPAAVDTLEGYGVENLTWTPSVTFRHCIVRNNRARGALFSSPRRTVCENNLFDHTSGTAILLCGDCNGWYESGAVRNLVIRRNRFVNALTNLFQFTNAVISIYPEIPRLDAATTCFHGGTPDAIRIEDNLFETFDTPLIYAKSTDGMIIRGNKVKRNHDFESFHPNQQQLLLEHCRNVTFNEDSFIEKK